MNSSGDFHFSEEDTPTAFIIKFWVEEINENHIKNLLRGRITHVTTGKTINLTKLSEISSFIEPYLTELDAIFVPSPSTKELKIIQRLFQLSAIPENVECLLSEGLHSAYDITQIPEKVFIQKYVDDFGADEAAKIYRRAKRAMFISGLRRVLHFPISWLNPEAREDKIHLFNELENALLDEEKKDANKKI